MSSTTVSAASSFPGSATSTTASPVITEFSTVTVPVPSLSASGWVYATAEKANFLMAHIFESDALQSYVYSGHITSIQQILQKYGNNIANSQRELQTALELYLGRYYAIASVRITTDDNAQNLTGAVTIGIQADVTENGITYSIGRLLNTSDSLIQSVVNLNDFGTRTAP